MTPDVVIVTIEDNLDTDLGKNYRGGLCDPSGGVTGQSLKDVGHGQP